MRCGRTCVHAVACDVFLSGDLLGWLNFLRSLRGDSPIKMRVDCLATCNTGGRWPARCLVGTAIVMFKGLRLGPLAPGWWDSFQSCPMHLKRSGARVWKAYQPTVREKPCSTVSVKSSVCSSSHPAEGVMPVLGCALGARRVAAAPKPSVRDQRRGVRLVHGRCATYFEGRGGLCRVACKVWPNLCARSGM